MAVHISLAVFTCINTTGRMFSAAINCCKSTFVVNMDRQNVTSLDIHPFDLVSRYPRKPRMPTENIFLVQASVDALLNQLPLYCYAFGYLWRMCLLE
ncbi:hypothetical protein Tco_0491396 [Tanacetum coccineum]